MLANNTDTQQLGQNSEQFSQTTLLIWHKGVKALFNQACSVNSELMITNVFHLVLVAMALRFNLTEMDVVRLKHIFLNNRELAEEELVDWLVRFKDTTPLIDALEDVIKG